MKDSVFQMTSDTYQSLSDSERHLLEYIYQHLDLIATLSIVKLSEDANVSTATIVRLMKKLGYDGYTSFKYALKEKHHLGHAPLMDDIDSQIKQAVLKNEREVLDTIKMLDIGLIEDAIQKISNAEKVYIFARGLSEMIGTEMTIKLQLLGKNCEMHSDPNIIRGKSKTLAKKDIGLFVSLNGETEELVEAAQNFKLQAISTITLTTRIDSRLAKLSEIVLVGFKGEQSFFPDYEVRSRLPLQVLSRIMLDSYVIRTAHS
ncbi:MULTISPECIES: MurR/RpiR family transcriptional regulator [Bacillus]|uniref:MurR/RpiR family transcriptional regulator n=1 Tax=Bacillus TaxID=1386 RepID=UPI00080DBAC0|nr:MULTISPECIES: MurR/RpiR family transcriptional regulator [Bacillus]MDE1383990.1 MurR/RpiR family transcriptional regulator [Bacillus paralicheniformis]PRS12668.1 MurR/RpiR family transcriptional regulator [Bacillus paralicheniformis]TAI51023.1 MurR/RpiR family transcriptional regulator [Bacillus paralicheniformis]GIN76293.1 RpiR family transcriptional regulator [Bacillus sp. J41TS8]